MNNEIKNIDQFLIIPDLKVKLNFTSSKEKEMVAVHLISAPGGDSNTSQKKAATRRTSIINEYPYFEAKPREILQSPQDWYLGIGPIKELDTDLLADSVRELMNKISFSLEKVQILLGNEIFSMLETKYLANIFITAAGVSAYPVDLLKTTSSSKRIKLKEITFVVPSSKLADFKKASLRYKILVNHINGMRQIQSLPGNYLTPVSTEKKARLLAKKYGLSIKVLDTKALKKIGAGGILAVSAGSVQEPRVIVLEYKPPKVSKKCPTLALVGKGVTFDSGGISIKPSSDMHEMKYDMSGAASVLHSVSAIAELKLPVHVVGVVGMVENMPGAAAFKPGDVYISLKGTSIEVQNTDAEGRLVLGDLLYYAEKNYKPQLMLNLATLTGACMVALGTFYAGCFSRNEKVLDFLKESSRSSLEPLWPLPLSKRYTELLKSDIADHNNIGGRWGGASSAASFLSLFVDEKTNWAHLDIAGIGFIKSPFHVYPSVATGFGIRLLTDVAEHLVKNPRSFNSK